MTPRAEDIIETTFLRAREDEVARLVADHVVSLHREQKWTVESLVAALRELEAQVASTTDEKPL